MVAYATMLVQSNNSLVHEISSCVNVKKKISYAYFWQLRGIRGYKIFYEYFLLSKLSNNGQIESSLAFQLCLDSNVYCDNHNK